MVEDILSDTSTLTITPVAPEMEGMFENLCLNVTTWKTPSQGQASDSCHANVSSLLDFRGSGTEDLRLALPNISGVKDSRRLERWALTRGDFVPLLERGELEVATQPSDEDTKVRKVRLEASSREVLIVMDQLAGIRIKNEGDSSVDETAGKASKPGFQSWFTGSGYV